MTEVLLKELSNQDIDWMLTVGDRKEIDSGTVLIRQGQPLDALHIILDGALTVSLTRDNANPLGSCVCSFGRWYVSGTRNYAVVEWGDGRRNSFYEKLLTIYHRYCCY